MKEKTAMQQLIHLLELAVGNPIPESIRSEYLQKERQQIEAAVDYCDKMFCDLGYVPTGSKYFTETYGE